MRKHRRTLLLAGLVALILVGTLAWLALRPRELVYEGKTLSEWLTPGRNADFGPGTEDAVRHIGTNAIPLLLKMLHAHDSKLKLQLIALVEKQHLVKFNFVPAARRNREASLAFLFLGPAASNAVPDLIQISEEKASEVSQLSTIMSLGYIGPTAKAAAPDLLRTLANTNASKGIRVTAIWALVQLQADPGAVVPALIKCLQDPDSQVRVDAVVALQELGTAARAAVPALVDLLKDPNRNVGGQAELALKAIDPEAAAKAGIR